jgi:hypothetical protein
MAAQFGGRGECRRCGGTGGRVWGRCGPAAGRARPAPLASRGAGWRNGGLVSGGRKKRGRTPRLVFYVTTSACMTRTRWSRASRAATWRAACAARTHGARALRGRGLQWKRWGRGSGVERGTAQSCHVDATSRTCARAGAASMSPDPILFRDSLFEIIKLQKVSSYSKISKNKICRGAIDLQLWQRVTYVLINGFVEKTRWNSSKFRPLVTVRRNFISNWSGFALKIGMSVNYEKCVPKDKEEILYRSVLNFYREIWRTHKKTELASWILRGLTTYLDFDQKLLCKSVHKHVKHA